MVIDSLDCLTTCYSVTTSTCDEIDNLDDAFTTLTTTLTTADTVLDSHQITINLAHNYVDSLSTEELAKLTTALDEKEVELKNSDFVADFNDFEKGNVKVYQKEF